MVVGAKIEKTARDNGAAASSSSIPHFRRRHTFQLRRMICRCWGVTSGSLSRCSPPCYKSPLRTERQPEDSTLCWRAASFVQGLDDSVDGYIVADGCRRCRLFAPRSRRAAGAAILRCDTQPLVGLQAPLRIVECQEPLYDWAGGLETARLQAPYCTLAAICMLRVCCLPSPARCAKAGISGPGADVFPSVITRRRGHRPGESP